MDHIATDAAQSFPQTASETNLLPRLHMKDIVKDFPGVRALDHVDFVVQAGEIMGLAAEPEFAKIYRHERAIPQYLTGHAKRLELIESELRQHPGLVLTGNAYRGVSLNDCVVNAGRVADQLAGERGESAA